MRLYGVHKAQVGAPTAYMACALSSFLSTYSEGARSPHWYTRKTIKWTSMLGRILYSLILGLRDEWAETHRQMIKSEIAVILLEAT
jgi:hypothetical protein